MIWSLKANTVGFVRVGLLALLFSAAYPLWLVLRFHASPVDFSTIIFRGGCSSWRLVQRSSLACCMRQARAMLN